MHTGSYSTVITDAPQDMAYDRLFPQILLGIHIHSSADIPFFPCEHAFKQCSLRELVYNIIKLYNFIVHPNISLLKLTA